MPQTGSALPRLQLLNLAGRPCSQEERKAALRQAAQESKETGKATSAFDDSQYAVSGRHCKYSIKLPL